MSLLLYQLFLFLYRTGAHLSAAFNEKSRKWVEGRRGLLQRISGQLTTAGKGKRVWIHCASLGEFEQGRPVIEELKKNYPGCIIILTFFSPSGYEIRKDYELVDFVFYLPMDGRRNAVRFLDAVRPDLALFVKYEFWYYYLRTLKDRSIPAMLISAAFRPSQIFFTWYGGLFRELLGTFNYLFVQDKSSRELLAQAGLSKNVILGGDTRYDRVAAIAAAAGEIPAVAAFRGNGSLLIGGSTWPDDEALLQAALPQLPPDWKLVIAPHEIDEPHLLQVVRLFGSDAVRYSGFDPVRDAAKRVLVIDNIGMLSGLYRYGALAFVGGGFAKGGIHNILEPAVFGMPVVFGPVYKKFVEAVALVEKGYAFPVTGKTDGATLLRELAADCARRQAISRELQQYMLSSRGATTKIMNIIEANRWLD